jgi:hypothetical protein
MTIRPACAVILLALMAACQQQPYIYEIGEFNRERADFGRERTDRTEVDVCYVTRNTTPQDLLATAEAECAKFGKTARYRYSDVLECPMVTPLRARFACEGR